MLALDDGPLFVFKRVRYWVKDKAWLEATVANEIYYSSNDVNGEIGERWFGKWHNLAEGITCPYCVGVWLSLPLFAMLVWPTYGGDLFLLLMAISGGQAFLQSLDKD
jgi:hypothetical protein